MEELATCILYTVFFVQMVLTGLEVRDLWLHCKIISHMDECLSSFVFPVSCFFIKIYPGASPWHTCMDSFLFILGMLGNKMKTYIFGNRLLSCVCLKLFSARQNNFPPVPKFCPVGPCFYQDFSVDIPLEFQRIVKFVFFLWGG